MTRLRTSIAALAALYLLAAPAYAAIELEPGMWQDTETGTEDGKPLKPDVSTDCMTPEEAKDPLKGLAAMSDIGEQCKTKDVKQSGNTVTLVVQCGGPNRMSADMTTTYTFVDRKHYTGTIKSTVTMAGKQITFDKKVDSKWIGACKK